MDRNKGEVIIGVVVATGICAVLIRIASCVEKDILADTKAYSAVEEQRHILELEMLERGYSYRARPGVLAAEWIAPECDHPSHQGEGDELP